MWELDYKENLVPKNWCFWTVVLKKTLESPLDWKEIQPVHPKGNQSWVFMGRTDVVAESPILWPPDAKSWLIGKDPDAGKDWGREEKGMRGWDGWMASLTQWTWVWMDSGSWWWTGRPDMLQFMGLQRVRHNWVTELTSPLGHLYLLPPSSLLYVTLWRSLSVPGCAEHIGVWLLARLFSPLLISPLLCLVTSTSLLPLLLSM